MKKLDFLHAYTNSLKFKVDWKILGGHGHKWLCHSDRKTLKLAVSHEVINGINWFLVCWYKFRKV